LFGFLPKIFGWLTEFTILARIWLQVTTTRGQFLTYCVFANSLLMVIPQFACLPTPLPG